MSITNKFLYLIAAILLELLKFHALRTYDSARIAELERYLDKTLRLRD